jgi:hypothetical protein
MCEQYETVEMEHNFSYIKENTTRIQPASLARGGYPLLFGPDRVGLFWMKNLHPGCLSSVNETAAALQPSRPDPEKRLHHTEEFEGTCIGTANMSRIIARHDRRTWNRCRPAVAVLFYFSLPYTHGEARQ